VIWDEVTQAMVAALQADAQLVALLGDATRIFAMEEGVERRIPGVGYQLIYEAEEEVLNPIIVQIDYWAAKDGTTPARAQAALLEQRIRRVLHHPIRRDFGGIEMATLFVESRDMDDPKPGVIRRQLDFRFEPVKRRIIDT